ncbi:MAG: carbohydrate-binding protein [Firmicutes bacterium]|nr:carbohydrate-binding protein [Bacillota bacterium]
MRKKLIIVFSLMLMMVFAITICFADNPIVQTIYTADPAPMVYNGVCYVYTGHDADTLVNNFFTMNDWRCYSSTDMVNWTDHGAVLSYTNFSWAKGDCWAGQCIYRNGKFYYYVPMTQKTGGMAIGVAVATSPTGPFTDALGRPLVSTGTGDIDPTVYIDSDGQAYLYWGNPNLWYVKLNQDMISYSGSPTQIPLTTASFGVRSNTDRPTSYEEGPWFYKRNNLYYMIFAGGPISEHIAYSTSPGPTGPWTYRGIIMPTQGSSFTNHAGVCDYNGNSYFFYHNGALPGGGGYHRSVCVEKFTYNADGTIPTINMTTTGAPQIGTLNPYVRTEAETICWESGVETEVCGEGGINVCNIENGDYIKVKGVNFGSGATSFNARVASATSGGNIELRLDSPTGTLVGTCAVTSTGGWQTWVTRSCTVSGATGIHDLYLKFTGGSGFLFNVNWWQFNGSGVTPTVTPSPTPAPSATPLPTSGSRSAFSRIEAESFNSQSGIQTESCGEGGENIGYIENGDYAVYNNIDFGGGATGFEARVASNTSGGNIEIRLDSLSGTLVGTCSVAGTGGWQTWVTRTCSVSGASGTHNLYLRFTGGSGYLFNLNWFQFASGTVNTPTPTPTPGGSYVKIRNVATGLYIDGMGSTSNGSNACQYSSSSSYNQQWTLEAAGGYYKIKNRATGLYLDGMGRTSNGSICGQWSASSSYNQQWAQETAGSYVRFKNRATGLYLDGMGSTANGSNLCQWGNSGSTNQQWQIQ